MNDERKNCITRRDLYTTIFITSSSILYPYLITRAVMTIAGAKGFTIGAVSRGAGMTVAKVLPATVPSVIATTADLGAEIATMVTVSNALEGKMPHVQEFEDAALLVFGLRAAG